MYLVYELSCLCIFGLSGEWWDVLEWPQFSGEVYFIHGVKKCANFAVVQTIMYKKSFVDEFRQFLVVRYRIVFGTHFTLSTASRTISLKCNDIVDHSVLVNTRQIVMKCLVIFTTMLMLSVVVFNVDSVQGKSVPVWQRPVCDSAFCLWGNHLLSRRQWPSQLQWVLAVLQL